MSQPSTAEIKTSTPMRTGHVIMADGQKDAPSQIEIIRAGTWPASSVKGPLNITTADLQEFKANFEACVGMPKSLKQLPIDFSHDSWAEAAGWITSLEVVGESLMASVEWTTEGLEALQGGMFKCISPSFWPACCGEWYDPEDSEVTARNVLVGAGLTNIPFFKDLQPIMASNSSDKDGKRFDNVIYIKASNKENSMTLDEIRVKEASQLSEEEVKFANEHKEELSADEQKRLGIEASTDPKDPVADPAKTNKEEIEPVTDPEIAAINADIKSGKKVVVDASTFNSMQTKLGELSRDKIEASVVKHVERGAIKADQAEAWTERIVKDASVEDLLKALPNNVQMADSKGSSTQAANASALEDLEEKTKAIMASDTEIQYPTAFKKAMAENPELTKQLNEERES